MKFNLLGSLEVIHDQRVCTPSAPKIRQVLALLLLRANQVVSLDSVIEELWGEEPPKSAVTTAQTYIYQLRKAFARELGEQQASRMIETVPPGYILRVDEAQLDFREFDRLIEQSRALQAAGHVERSARQVRAALSLWKGAALSNVDHGTLLQGYATHLEEQRITALELRVQADMELGDHRAVIPELRRLVVSHRYNEWFHAQLIIALNKAGRRGDALEAYQSLRTLLNDELGLDPSAEVKRVHREVLNGGSLDASRLRSRDLQPTA
ncbi:AfsR/SARP family transcriptional regulator [Actinoallomurus sp. CA-150999]|uniref:AfsR/SARP family transcriptional regulator n=1 Tax=Actinoallomurus sp. CA-150999 TaxID=3239887 RepID=UPI003D931C80